MASNSLELLTLSSDNFFQHRTAVLVPMAVVFGLFTAAALTGEASTDEGLKTVLRFISLTLLATAISMGAAVGLRYINRSRRRLAGMVAAIAMGIGAGLIWTVTSVGAGFGIYMLGLVLTLLLAIKELNASQWRRRNTSL